MLAIVSRRGPGLLSLPNPINPPSGCPFHPRCPHAMPVCRERYPTLRTAAPGRTAACRLYGETAAELPNPSPPTS